MLKVHEERKFQSAFIATLIAVFSVLSLKSYALNQDIKGSISRVGDTTHLEFIGRKNWAYSSPRRVGDVVTIMLPAFDQVTQVQLQAWKCPFIQDVKVNTEAPDGQYEIQFTLSGNDIEVFDYLTDDPSALIFDFYKKATKASAASSQNGEKGENNKLQAVASSKKRKNLAKKAREKLPDKKSFSSNEYQKVDRKPAGDENLAVNTPAKEPDETAAMTPIGLDRGIYDGNDPNYDRFRIKDYQIKEESIISAQQNIYILFPMLAQKINRFRELMKNPPIYEIQAEENSENKEARLLYTLFQKQRYGSFVEVYDYFIKKYPQSKYDEIVRNMAAEVHIKLFDRDHDIKDYDEFRSQYVYLLENYPTSILAERNSLLLAYSSLERNDGVETLRNIQNYLVKYPNSSEKDYARFAIAESYGLLDKPQDAINTYQDVIKNPVDKKMAIEASFRLGDVYFANHEYQKALDSYKEVQKKYPQSKEAYANAQYNSAAAEFSLGKYKESLNDFIDFIKMFPSNKYGGFALTRIGELLEILGADQKQVVGAFTEGYFRFPDSQGSEVARVRMLSQNLKDMKEREKRHAISEINHISETSTLPQIQEFATLMTSVGLSKRGEYEDSLDLLLTYYQQHPTSTKVDLFRSRILRNISDILKEEVDKKNYIDALSFYGKYSTTWLKKSKRIDAPYFQAFAYEHSGVLKEAESEYIGILENLKRISGTKEEKEKKVYEYLPSISELNLRLGAVAVGLRKYREAYRYLSEIKSTLNENDDIERVQLSAQVSEQMGDIPKAIGFLKKLVANYEKHPEGMIAPIFNLARLNLLTGQLAECENYIGKIEKFKNKNGKVSDEIWAKALALKGDLQLKQGQHLAAVDTYMKLLDGYESTLPLSSVRYKAGKVLFDLGDLKGAEKIWNGFDAKMGQFYQQLAQEKLNEAGFHNDFKKYINRIPAASELR